MLEAGFGASNISCSEVCVPSWFAGGNHGCLHAIDLTLGGWMDPPPHPRLPWTPPGGGAWANTTDTSAAEAWGGGVSRVVL